MTPIAVQQWWWRGSLRGWGAPISQRLHASKDINRVQHPTGRLSAVPAALLDGQDRHKLLAAWLRRVGQIR